MRKKIRFILIFILLIVFLGGCGKSVENNNKDKSNDNNKGNGIYTDKEKDDAEGNEKEGNGDKEDKGDKEDNEDKEDKEDKEQKISKDITDKEELFDFYLNEVNTNLTKDDITDELDVVHGDFNGDGSLDAALFVSSGLFLRDVILVGIEDGEFKRIQSEYQFGTKYYHNIYFDGLFLHHVMDYGFSESGYSDEVLLVFDGEKMVETGAKLMIEGREMRNDGSIVNMKGDIITDRPNNYRNFIYEYRETTEEDVLLKEEKRRYSYDEENHYFTMEVISIKTPEIEGFQNETIEFDGEEFLVEYDKYNTVMMIMQESINDHKLESIVCDFDPEEQRDYIYLSIFGELKDVVVIYDENPLVESVKPIKQEMGDLKDTKLIVDAPMPSDFSGIFVEGIVVDKNGEEKEVRIFLDLMEVENCGVIVY